MSRAYECAIVGRHSRHIHQVIKDLFSNVATDVATQQNCGMELAPEKGDFSIPHRTKERERKTPDQSIILGA
jgi:hypothetical protein